jgi:hypothetical protein
MTNLAADRAATHTTNLQTDDPVSDALLDGLVRGLLDPADRFSLAAHGDGDTILEPWAALTDPRVAPLWAIPHVAQWMGGVPPIRRAGETDDEYLTRARAELIRPRGMLRGGQDSLKITTRAFLTGTQTVRVLERPDGDLWSAIVLVKTSEIGGRTSQLEAALNDNEIVPVGFEITVIPDDAPLVDEGTLTVNAAGTITIDTATLDDVT